MRRLLAAVALVTASGCTRARTLYPTDHAVREGSGGAARFHLTDGEVVDATSWRLDESGSFVGQGARYSIERELVTEGTFRVRRRDVDLVEVRETRVIPSLVPLGVVSVASLGLTAYCIGARKACFGSCPTFYVRGASGVPSLQAEGFSTSVARRLEADDVDLLPLAAARDGAIELEMRNEAVETHYLRRVALEVVDGPAGTAVHRLAAGGYVALGPAARPLDAPVLAEDDGVELTPGSDGVDLAARGSITLRFPPPLARRTALLLTARNSLMNTWVFYRVLARLGPEMGRFFAAIERGDEAALGALRAFDEALGGVTVSTRQEGEGWRAAGEFGYLGPIARVTQAVAFDVARPDAALEVRLDFARAHWRFDRAQVAPVRAEGLRPATIDPEVTAASEGHDRALAARSLRGEGERLGTLPGDVLRLRFRVPAARDEGARAYFVRSRGYYYEWGREAWRAEADPAEGRRILADPRGALRALAPAFARAEPGLEASFEASRVPTREAR